MPWHRWELKVPSCALGLARAVGLGCQVPHLVQRIRGVGNELPDGYVRTALCHQAHVTAADWTRQDMQRCLV